MGHQYAPQSIALLKLNSTTQQYRPVGLELQPCRTKQFVTQLNKHHLAGSIGTSTRTTQHRHLAATPPPAASAAPQHLQLPLHWTTSALQRLHHHQQLSLLLFFLIFYFVRKERKKKKKRPATARRHMPNHHARKACVAFWKDTTLIAPSTPAQEGLDFHPHHHSIVERDCEV